MAYAKATLINRIRRELGDNPWVDFVTEADGPPAIDATETTITIADTTKWDVGNILEFSDDGEQCLVTTLTSATVLTVVRNWNLSVGTTLGTGTTHLTGVAIYADPVFKYVEITEAISAVMDELWPHVYRTIDLSISPTSGTYWYEVDESADNDSKVLDLHKVVQAYQTSPYQFQEYGVDANYPIGLYHNMPSAIFGSTRALYIPRLRHSTNTIYVTGIGRMDDTVVTTNYSYLNNGVEVDTVILLAAGRLLRNLEVARDTQQDISMGDATVTPGVRSRLARDFEEKGLRSRQRWETKLRAVSPVLPMGRGRIQ